MRTWMICGVVFATACGVDQPAKIGATQQASTQVTVSHQVQTGRDASLTWYISDQTSGSLDSFEVATRGPGVPSAMLSVATFTIDPTTGYYTSTATFAPLPSGALHVSPDDRSASLNVTTGPDATTITCTGQIGVSTTCSSAPSLPVSISVTWQSDGLFHAFSSGTSESTMPGFTWRSQGMGTSNAANASGSVGDVAVPPGATAWINDSNNTQIVRDVLQTP